MAKDVFSDFLRGVGHADLPGKGTQAHFAGEKSVLAASGLEFAPGNEDGKIFLGVFGAEVNARRLPSGRLERHAEGGKPIGIADDRHIVTVAGSRAGKGRSVIVPNLLSYPGSMLVIDPKGELAAQTAAHRARTFKGAKIHVLDPFRVSGEEALQFSAKFNPLDMLSVDSKTLLEDAGSIADALVVQAGSDPHWDESARQFLETLILHVAISDAYAGKSRDLTEVARLVDTALSDQTRDDLLNNDLAEKIVQRGARYFYDRHEEELSSVLSSTRRHVHFLSYPQMHAVLQGPSSFALADLKRQNTTLFLILPAMRMGTCSRWLRLFVNLTLSAMETETAKTKHPVLMCLDEFAVLGHMASIETAAGQIAGLGVKLWPILQDLGQLKALYGERWETFLGNAGLLQFFGNSDLTTLEWISKRLGDTTVLSEAKSDLTFTGRNRDSQRGTRGSESIHPLMTAEEISRFFGRDDHLMRQLIIRPSHTAMVIQRVLHDSHELFRGKASRVSS